MIVKKIKADRVKSKAGHIRDLTDYIRNPQARNPGEKVLYERGRGFLCEDHESQQAEMVALAQEAVKSPNPVSHWVLSWREGEQPSVEQVEEAVSLFLGELGISEHQVIYALHRDTDNLHLHIAVNRVHPDTLKVIKPNGGFDIEAAHRAVARIEHAQGWERERHGRYHVLENGELRRDSQERPEIRQPEQRKRDMEHRTGEKSAERIAIEEGAPILRAARSWEQLHAELAQVGMRYEKTGSGATLFVGEVGVKASRADRGASLSKLEARLGAFEPVQGPQHVAERSAQPLREGVPCATYVADRRAHYAAKSEATLDLWVRQERERKALAVEQRARREKVFEGQFRGQGAVRNQMRSLLAAEQASEKVALKERQALERAALRGQFPPYPDLERWLRERQQPGLAEQWRYRHSEPMRIEGGERVEVGEQVESPTPRDIRAYTPEVVGDAVHYFRKDGGWGRQASFVDKGRQIDIYDWRSRESVRAALQLSAQKWGTIQVWGSDEYKALCAEVAAEHGLRVINPELQPRIEQERQRLREARPVPEPVERAFGAVELAPSRAGAEPLRESRGVEPEAGESLAAEAYRRHRRDVLQEPGAADVHPSRVDARVAVRMRVHGFAQREIEAALRQNAVGERGGRELEEYARRTARYAFGAAGDRQAVALKPLQGRWPPVPGRQPALELGRDPLDRGRGLGR